MGRLKDVLLVIERPAGRHKRIVTKRAIAGVKPFPPTHEQILVILTLHDRSTRVEFYILPSGDCAQQIRNLLVAYANLDNLIIFQASITLLVRLKGRLARCRGHRRGVTGCTIDCRMALY